MADIDTFENMLASGQDSPMLRLTLGREYLKAGEPGQAVAHLKAALDQDAEYSAAWNAYGKALMEAGRDDDAIRAYEQGIEVAERKGDKQASKEMNVFLKRLRKAQPSG